MTGRPLVHVLCVLAVEQRRGYEAELGRIAALGIELVHEESPDRALDLVGARKFPMVIVGMTVEMMDGLEFLALLMQRYKDFAGRVVVLPDKGDPFPPMLQVRDPQTGKSSTEAIDLVKLEALAKELVASAAPKPAEPKPERAELPSKPGKPPLPTRASAPKAAAKAEAAAVKPVIAPEPTPPPVVVAPPEPVVAPAPERAVAPPPEPVVVPPPEPIAVPVAAPAQLATPQPIAIPAPAPVTELTARQPSAEPVLAASMHAAQPPAQPRRQGPLIAGIVGLGVVALAAAVAIRACSASSAERPPTQAATSAGPSPSPNSSETAAPVVPAVAKPEPKPEPTPSPSTRDPSQPVALPLSFEKRHADYTVADSSKLDSVVADLANQLRENKSARLEVGGHTSTEGAESFNFELGQRRADEARNYLVKHGIPAARIVVKNYGASQPTNDPDADRRVTVRLIEGGAK